MFFNVWEQRLGNHTPTAVPSGTLPPWLTVPTRPALSNSLTSDVGVQVVLSGLLFVYTRSSQFYLIYQQSNSRTWAPSKLPMECDTPWSAMDYVTESDITFTIKASSFCRLWLLHIRFPTNKTFQTATKGQSHSIMGFMQVYANEQNNDVSFNVNTKLSIFIVLYFWTSCAWLISACYSTAEFFLSFVTAPPLGWHHLGR